MRVPTMATMKVLSSEPGLVESLVPMKAPKKDSMKE